MDNKVCLGCSASFVGGQTTRCRELPPRMVLREHKYFSFYTRRPDRLISVEAEPLLMAEDYSVLEEFGSRIHISSRRLNENSPYPLSVVRPKCRKSPVKRCLAPAPMIAPSSMGRSLSGNLRVEKRGWSVGAGGGSNDLYEAEQFL